MSVLVVERLGAALSGRQVLRDISFSLKPGEFVGLIGPNGAGKSSLMRGILGLIPTVGKIAVNGRDASQIKPREMARAIAYIAQGRDVAWAMPVGSVVALGRIPHLSGFAPSRPTDHQAVENALAQMDLEDFRERPATQLSGGELARVLVARALAQETALLLADEPAAGLDPAHQISLMRLFADLAGRGRTVLVSTHDLGLAARYCSRLLLLNDSRLVADGSPETVLTPDNLRDVYGVEAFFAQAGGRLVLQPIELSTPQLTES